MTINKKEYLENWKNKLNAGINTYELQMMSLQDFLLKIGYLLELDNTTSTYHVKRYNNSSNPMFISLEIAVGLHNGGLCLIRNHTVSPMRMPWLEFDKEAYYDAMDSKLVRIVKLQRRNSGIFVRENWVELL